MQWNGAYKHEYAADYIHEYDYALEDTELVNTDAELVFRIVITDAFNTDDKLVPLEDIYAGRA